jgi:hypothetical protein
MGLVIPAALGISMVAVTASLRSQLNGLKTVSSAVLGAYAPVAVYPIAEGHQAFGKNLAASSSAHSNLVFTW